jgi:molybdenum transport protein
VVERRVAAGALLPPGEVILQARGEAGALHLGWKVGLNLVEWCSGVATATHRLVRAARAEQPGISIAATRKVFPGTKRLALGAVLAGGGVPHRLGLSDSVLVFPQHVAMLGGLDALIALLDPLRAGAPERKVVVEVHNAEDALRVAAAGVNILQIDKLPPEELAVLVPRLREVAPALLIAAAGGINQGNVAEYARTGVAILVTSAMYAARPADVGVVIEPC